MSRRRKRTCIAICFVMVAAWAFGFEIWRRGETRYIQTTIMDRSWPMTVMLLALNEYRESHQGQSPETMSDLLAGSPALADPGLREQDALRNRVFERAVLFRDVRVRDGRVLRCVVAVHVPRGYPLLRDYIYAVGDEVGTYFTITEAEALFGEEMVHTVRRSEAATTG